MSLMLPPCIRKALESKENLNQCLMVVGAYFKSYARSPSDILSSVPQDMLPDVWSASKSKMTPIFSCDLVAQHCPDFCDESKCPLVSDEDPVDFLVTRIMRAEWDLETKDVAIWFNGVAEPLVFNVKNALKSPSEARAEIAVFTLEHFGRAIILSKIKTKDEDGRKFTRDLLLEFINQVYSHAVKIAGNDVEGIGELILDIIQKHQITPRDLATVECDVFVYQESGGKRYIAVEPRLFRAKVRNYLGITSNSRLVNVLRRYNILKRRIRVHGERGYFFLIPETTIRKYSGMDIDDAVRASADISELFADIGEGDGK